MIQTLMRAEEVLDMAFKAGEYLPTSALATAQIAAAEERYIRPLVGATLYNELLAGDHQELCDGYVKPLLAYGVKYLLLPQLQLQVGACGLNTPNKASEETLTAVRNALKQQIESLGRRLSRTLEELHRSGELPAYDPEQNIRNRCRIYGGVVQIL